MTPNYIWISHCSFLKMREGVIKEKEARRPALKHAVIKKAKDFISGNKG